MAKTKSATQVVSYGAAKAKRQRQKPIAGRYASVDQAVSALRPARPLYCMHPDKIAESARLFVERFPGKTFYAVKSNPELYVLQRLWAAGIRCFDVASLTEIKRIRELFPEAELAFMNTIKAREAISAAYFEYGVRTFVCDTRQELEKIRTETNGAADLTVCVRLGMPRGTALHPLSIKFGANDDQCVALLQEAAKTAARVGLSFHVGSQTMDPVSYANALQKVANVVARSGVKLEVLDVGGGFPVPSSNDHAPALPVFIDTVRQEFAKLPFADHCQLWCEPGTALCGPSTTLVLRVELRKGDALYLNDGGYGALFDCCWSHATRDMRAVYADPDAHIGAAPLKAFHIYGPTCDSADELEKPVLLPDDVDEGDFIVVKDMGAYGVAMQNGFNGFYSDQKVEIDPSRTAKVERIHK